MSQPIDQSSPKLVENLGIERTLLNSKIKQSIGTFCCRHVPNERLPIQPFLHLQDNGCQLMLLTFRLK